MTHAVQATPPDEPGRRHLLRPVVVNSLLGPVLTLSIRGMTDTRTTRRTSDHDDTSRAGAHTRTASTGDDSDTDARSKTNRSGSTDDPTPAVSYAGDGAEGTELPIETHGAHSRETTGDV